MRSVFYKCRHIIQSEAVLILSALAAIISMFFVPPSATYLEYIDLQVLCQLFCLMSVVAGLQKAGLFTFLSGKLLAGAKNLKILGLILVLFPFFSSMFITNDVALLTFVPFAITVLSLTGQTRHLSFVIVLQTVAANLGSMLTPIGNPQNLFLYSRYHIGILDFFSVTLPITLLSLVLVGVASLFLPKSRITVDLKETALPCNRFGLSLHAVLFVLSLLAVFRIIHYGIVFGIVVVALLIFDRRLFGKVDYSLLATFVCFFIFAGNLGNIEPIKQFLASILEQQTVLSSAAVSQVMSNVPAAVLLSAFTENWKGLLIGTNVGGLGTIIASLASLISFKFYLKTSGAKPLRYLGLFTLANAAGLAILLTFSLWILPA